MANSQHIIYNYKLKDTIVIIVSYLQSRSVHGGCPSLKMLISIGLLTLTDNLEVATLSPVFLVIHHRG